MARRNKNPVAQHANKLKDVVSFILVLGNDALSSVETCADIIDMYPSMPSAEKVQTFLIEKPMDEVTV
jgi:hypothetical protein